MVALYALIPSASSAADLVQQIYPPEHGFYSKVLNYRGIPIKSSAVVSDTALVEAAKRLARMLDAMPAVVQNLVSERAELHIIGKHQNTSDLPEHRDAKGKPFLSSEWTIDSRTRGVGGIYASCGEENLLDIANDDRYAGRDICLHEFAHTVMEFGLDEPIRKLIKSQYRASILSNHWKTTYAATNEKEFFAELAMWYFGTRGDYGKLTTMQPGRKWLKSYDPESFRLLDKIYSGQLQPQVIRISDLQQLSLSELPARSGLSILPASIRFFNKTARPVSMFWIDQSGVRRPYATIAPYARLLQQTYAGHVFMLADESGRTEACFRAEPGHRVAIFK